MTTSTEAAVFAGRAEELSILKDAADAANAGRFGVVLISGEPGIGKTRLSEEACNYARELGFEIAAGRCFDNQSRVSYFPFIQVLRHLAKHRSAAAAAMRKRRTKPAAEAADLIAMLGVATSRPPRPKPEATNAGQAELFESVVCFLRVRSESRPLLLLIEDLDWADQGSLSLLVHLVRMLTAAPLLVIGTCRGDYRSQPLELGRVLAECARQRCCQRLRLKGLSENEASSLVEQLLGPDSADAGKQLAPDIAKLAKGNPLFIHRIVRHLIESGRLIKRGNQWAVASGWESKLAAEDGLREAVDARLSLLSDGCHEALRHAAILGDLFEFEVLAKMVRSRVNELAASLEEASGAGIITEGPADENADYAFVHGLIRQSLYERQSRPAKRALHASAAQAIEAAHPADLDLYLLQLALHYTRAGARGDPAKAVEYSIRAGEMAYAASAYADAARHWRAALKLMRVSERKLRAQLTERLGEASLRAATPAEAARYLRASLKLYTELGQQSDVARVRALLLTIVSLRKVGQSVSLLTMNPGAADAVCDSEGRQKQLAAPDEPNAEGELLIGAAIAAHAQFRTSDGLASAARAMAVAERFNNTANWCQAAAFHGHFLLAGGKLKDGIGLMQRAIERAERMRDPKPRFAAAWLLSFSYLLLYDPGAAERTIETAMAEVNAEQADFLYQVLLAHMGMANLYAGALARARALLRMTPHRFLEASLCFFEGDWSRAEDLLNQQIESAQLAQSKQQHWTASLWLARLKRIQDDNRRALEILTNTPLIAESLLRIPEEIATRCELALMRLEREEIADAGAEVRRCRALLTPGEDWRALSGYVDRAEAALLTYDGAWDKARQRWMEAEKVFSHYQLPWEVAETFVICGTLLLRQGKAEEGIANLSAAIQIYRRLDLGARWEARVQNLCGPTKISPAAEFHAPLGPVQALVRAAPGPNGIYSVAASQDVALLATLIHDAIAHMMNAIDKAAKVRVPIERIAAATEQISKISTPVDRLARALEQATRGSMPGLLHRDPQRARAGRSRRQKLDRSHDPGRPL
jgi:AAA ATPase domain